MMFLLHSYIPDSIAFHAGPLSIHWYGIFLTSAILVGFWIVGRLSKKEGLLSHVATSIYVNALIGGLAGARIYHVATDWQFYAQRPGQIFAVWNGGLAIHGAMIGVILTLVYFARRHKINFFKLADLFVLPAILGQSIGRWGNYFNQELFGRPTNVFWGIPIDEARRPVGFERFTHFHPAFLYESILDLIAFVVLLFVYKKQKRPQGIVFWLYLGLYSAARIMTESIRINDAAYVFGMRMPMVVSAVLAAVSVVMILKTIICYKASD